MFKTSFDGSPSKKKTRARASAYNPANMMYCPKCAKENGEDVKFCRVCGQSLELVALALAGKPAPSTNQAIGLATIPEWLQAQRAGTRQIIQGIVLLAVSAKIGLISYLTVSSPELPWFLFWVIFFGWLAGWGAISLSFGLSKAIEAKLALRHLRAQPKEIASNLLAPHNETAVAELPSVTEHTTRQLQER